MEQYLAWFILWFSLTFLILPLMFAENGSDYFGDVMCGMILQLFTALSCAIVWATNWALKVLL